MNEQLRQLPSVDRLLTEERIKPFLTKLPRPLVVQALRAGLDKLRNQIRQGKLRAGTDVVALLTGELEQKGRLLIQPVINGTGVILHTNLGRSPLPPEILSHVLSTCAGYSNLEFDLTTHKRGSRYQGVKELLGLLTKTEDSLVVNNNAAAVLLTLKGLAEGREVIVSRGELVEIGGGFRIPEVIEESGCILREVGTTNKTRIADFRTAISENTAAILKVHPSNYKMMGFTSEAKRSELAQLCKDHGLWFVEDLGSGALARLPHPGENEPLVSEVAQFAHVVTYSGDKLLGGPQAGIISGKQDAIDKIKSRPLLRALRSDKFTLMALEQILIKYLNQDFQDLPLWRMINTSQDELEKRARGYLENLGPHLTGQIQQGFSTIGGGSLPGEAIASVQIALSSSKLTADGIAKLFARENPPIIGFIQANQFLLDMRTISPTDDGFVQAVLAKGVY